MDRRVTPPKRVTSPTWGPPPSCKQALKRALFVHCFIRARARSNPLERKGVFVMKTVVCRNKSHL